MGSKSKHDPSEILKKSKKKAQEVVTEAKSGDKKKKHEKHRAAESDSEKNNVQLHVEGKAGQRKGLSSNEKKDGNKAISRKHGTPKKDNPLTRHKHSDSDSDLSSSDNDLGSSLKKKASSSSSSEAGSSSSDEDSDDPHGKNEMKSKAAITSEIFLPKNSSKKNTTISSVQKSLNTSVKHGEKRKLSETLPVKKPVSQQVELPRKKVKVMEKKIYTSSEDEDDDEHEHDSPETESPPKLEQEKKEAKSGETEKDDKTNTDCFLEGWTKHDVFELVHRMELAIPRNDTLKYNSRVDKLNWEQIKFDPYTGEECKERWKQIEKRLRGYRLLEELLGDAKEWIEKPWTDFYRSGKKNRHPDLPKRPLTSYMLFYMDKKEKCAKKHPGLEMTSLSKIIAEKYKNLPPKKKDKYNALALNMREEYKEKMQKFLKEHPVEALRISKNTAKKGPPLGMPGPVKPVPPFKLFVEAKLKQHKTDPNFHSTVFMHECKNKWKIMSNKKKMPWIRWAHENEVKYLEEIKMYKTENPNFEVPTVKSVLSKDEKTIFERMQGKPEKPPNSAYSLFSRVMLKDPELRTKYDTPKERMQEIAKLWKSLPKLDREMYVEEVKRMVDSYKMEYATYLDSLSEEQREEELANNVPKRKPKVEAVVKPVKKLKQVRINDILSESAISETKEPVQTDIFTREPPQPPGEPFLVFKEEFIKGGETNEKKAKKIWMAMPNEEKEKYKAKLEELKQQFFIDYKSFLTSLNPDELKAYSTYRVNTMVAKQKEDNTESDDSESSSESSEESDDDDDDDKSKGESEKKAESSDSSSSSDDDSDSD